MEEEIEFEDIKLSITFDIEIKKYKIVYQYMTISVGQTIKGALSNLIKAPDFDELTSAL